MNVLQTRCRSKKRQSRAGRWEMGCAKQCEGKKSHSGMYFKLNCDALFFQGSRDDFSHAAGTLAVGVDAIGKHLVAIAGKERMEVDYLQAVFPCHLLLDGNDTVDYYRVTDVPPRLNSRDRGAEEDLRLDV